MRKNKFIIHTVVLISIMVFTNCDGYLDVAPDDRLELDSLEKAAKVVAAGYSHAGYVFTEMYTDLAGPTGNPDANGISQTAGGSNIKIQHTQAYTWEVIDWRDQDSPTYCWNNSYNAIAQTNEVLAVIDKLEGDQDFKNTVKGEALLSRAYHHFMLVNLFGMHYDENAGTNMGVPYIVEPETEFFPSYKRNTVAEVYDLAEKDLLEGLSLINDKYFSGTKKYHFTKKAALGFASRFYLWKKDYANCKKYSDLFLGDSPSSYIKNLQTIKAANHDETADRYGSLEDESNVMVMQKYSAYQRRDGYGLNSSDLKKLFRNALNSEDQRISVGIFVLGDLRYLARLREHFYRKNLSSNSGYAYYIAVVIKGEEIVLNRAEANLFLGDKSKALEDINLLAKKRYKGQFYSDDLTVLMNYYKVSDEKKAIEKLILDERKKEFWDYGLRWFDIKRFDIPITHVLPVSKGGETHELPAGDLRRAVQIPADAIAAGLTPNPR